MPRILPLNLRFKGQRDYVQGPDLYDAVCSVLSEHGFTELSKINFVAHRLVREGVSAHLEDSQPRQTPEDACAVFQFEYDGQRHVAYLISNGEVITKREEFPEQEIVSACGIDVDQQRIVLDRTVPFSCAETVVSMNKALLQALFPDAGGKWLFTRFQLDQTIWPNRPSDLQIALQANLNFAVTRSSISSNGRSIGHVFFSLVK